MNIRASSEIARHVRDRVATLGYKTTDDKSRPDHLHTLKDRLRNGPGDIRILAKNRFEIALSATQFNQTVRREFFDGIVRVKGLEKAVRTLSEGKAAAAWVLTTCYYTSFFAAIEILRCNGSFVSYFHEDAANQIKQRSSTATGHDIESGTYVGSAEPDSTTGIEHWNVLCRWAFLDSLSNPNRPVIVKNLPESNLEIHWDVFAGELGDYLLAVFAV